MELYGGVPFWLVHDTLADISDPLPERVDVVVIGAGIVGATVSDALTREGLAVAVIDRRIAATGSTAASTALLLYELDQELGQLSRILGAERATRAYRRTAATVEQLRTLALDLPQPTAFRSRESLYLASRLLHVRRLKNETRFRQEAGLDASWVTGKALQVEYGLRGHGAIHTRLAAEVDPVRLTQALLQRARRQGATISDRTTVLSVATGREGVTVSTDRGQVQARWCVCAMGYETPPGIIPPVVKLHSSYVLATEPLRDTGLFARGMMLWESARPYCYMRTTEDGRLLVGGADLPFRDPERRDAKLAQRTGVLERIARAWLPALDFRTAYAWCATFAETADGLPCIGPVPRMPGVLLALSAGGNGIVFSVIAAQIMTALCSGRSDPDADLFDPARLPHAS